MENLNRLSKPLQIELMQRCCKLAKNGLGFTTPNPIVGALLVKNNGTIVSEGWHHKYGDIHAEIDAINNAKSNGITDFSRLNLFVSLEPCNHFGKQPPCTDAIINAGIKNVFVGIEDPNPLVSGKGIAKLKDAGVAVKIGVAKKDCAEIIADYIHYTKTGLPYVTLKVAQSIDGYISAYPDCPKYLTSIESRREVHFMRSYCAVLVGINTILKDKPFLDNRLLSDKDIIKSAPSNIIVLDSKLRIPPNSKIFSERKNKNVFIAYNERYSRLKHKHPLAYKKRMERLKEKGAILIEAEVEGYSSIVKLNLSQILSHLASEYQIRHILVEGGGEVFTSFINANLCNELIIYTAPILLQGHRESFPRVDKEKLNDILKRYNREYNIVGSDVKSRFVESVI